MNWMQKLLAGFAVIGLVAIVGCGGGGDKDKAKGKTDGAGKAGTKTDGGGGTGGGATARTDLPAGDLKGPEGVMLTDIKMPKSAAVNHYWNDAKVGDWAEYEMTGGTVSRKEIVDLKANGLVEISAMKVAGMEIKSGMRMLFTEPDPKVENGKKGEEPKKSKDKVKVGDKELDCDVIEIGGAKTWTSKEVPLGGIVKSEAGGMVNMMLKAFGRGK
jgi:hypothetical protein